MTVRLALAGLAGLLAGAPALAQGGSVSDQCPAGSLAGTATPQQRIDAYTQDACQKAIDIFSFMTPQLGVSLAGGNPLLGARSSLGLGRVSLGLRATAIQGKLPDFERLTFGVNGAGPSEELETKDQILGAPGAELAVGVFPGLQLGPVRVGTLDGIVSANYIPEYDDENVRIEAPEGSLKLGYGGRVGVIAEGPLVPGVSVSYLRRDLPTLRLDARTGTDSLVLDEFRVKTSALRAVVSKNLAILGLAAGVGQDTYDASSDLRVVVRSPAECAVLGLGACRREIDFDESVTRTTMFANASVSLLFFRLGAEVGQVSGGDVSTYNTFADRDPNDSILYGSVALRFGF